MVCTVAGSALASTPTAQIRLIPVVTHPGGPYDTGGYYTSSNISGRRLTVGRGGGRTYWNVQIIGWGPKNALQSWVGTIDQSTLLGITADCGGGPGSCPEVGDLLLSAQPCSNNTACVNAFGEAGAVCAGSTCDAGFVNKNRGDWTHALISNGQGGFDEDVDGPYFWANSPTGELVLDWGFNRYGGTLVIDVPPNARGLYTIRWAPDTYFVDGATYSFAATLPGELEIVCLCDPDANNDGSVNSLDENAVVDCIRGDCSGCAATDCDADCDGDVDFVDLGVTRCEILGGSDCCNAPMGACVGWYWAPGYEACVETYQPTCDQGGGVYQGDDTACKDVACLCNGDVDDSGAVDTTDLNRVRSCAQYSVCTSCTNGCDVNCDGFVDYEDLAAAYCELQARSDCCNEPVGACTIPTGGWPECIETSQAVCQFYGGTYGGDDSPCDCVATRLFADANYCPGLAKLVRVVLDSFTAGTTVAIADTIPPGWTVAAISNGGSYDAVNHKVKWGPYFSSYPAEVTYEVTPDASTSPGCFSGTLSLDGVNNKVCTDECLSYQCCPFAAAETPGTVCGSCSVGSCAFCSSGSCQDGSVSLCEVISYGCAWVRGCNDDINGVTRAGFIWRNGECYCMDEAAQNFFPAACGAGHTCCIGSAAGMEVQTAAGSESALLHVTRPDLRGKTRQWELSVDLAPPAGTAAYAAEVNLPAGWTVTAVGEDGGYDEQHRKIKWGRISETRRRR